jgi:hypothetical protein
MKSKSGEVLISRARASPKVKVRDFLHTPDGTLVRFLLGRFEFTTTTGTTTGTIAVAADTALSSVIVIVNQRV